MGRFISWVVHPFFSDHAPIVLELDVGQRSSNYPFKLNPIWMEEKGFNELVASV
jgi:hypothetical protein